MATETVTSLQEYRSRDTVQALRELLYWAESGRLQGLVFIAKIGPARHRMGVTGDYWDDPAQALGAAARLLHRLNAEVSDAEGEGA